MEIIDINFNDLEPLHVPLAESTGPSPASGGGFELLMNNTKRNSSQNMEYNLSDLDKIQSEVNEQPNNAGNSFSSMFADTTKSFSNFFGSSSSAANSGSGDNESTKKLDNDDLFSMPSTKTWDGFSKMSQIPDTEIPASTTATSFSDREKRRKKRAMLRKLEEWHSKGMLSNQYSHFTMESSFEEIEDEYESALDDKRKKDSIKLQGWWFMTAINSVEYMNAAFNPFDLNLDGWGEQVSEDIESYEEIFGELHEKYKGGKLSPELSLLLRIGFSAAVVNFSNKALSSATPGFNDVIRQSPELMKEFTKATVQTMSQQSPGFAFAANLMNTPDKINTSFGAPPLPMETKPVARRPDIALGRGAQLPQPLPPQIQVNSASQQTAKRAEMRGPQATDIDVMLAGLKPAVSVAPPAATIHVEDVDSMISASSLADMQRHSDTPRRGRRKPSTEKSISLDL
jgi:hypothetical protein